ncbi:FxsA family protein [Tigheibacillus jepli]|uniref:FxsA family protein n=1 Tax=Tigheibacillus jepli TaxID=3035914 RepID=UPI002757743E
MRKLLPWFLVALLLEIIVFVLAVRWIGPLWVILLICATTFIGILLVKQQGFRIWMELQEALRYRQPPGNQILDGICVLCGAAFLIFPGFISDVIGFLLILPWTRVYFRRMIYRLLRLLFSKNIFIFHRRW